VEIRRTSILQILDFRSWDDGEFSDFLLIKSSLSDALKEMFLGVSQIKLLDWFELSNFGDKLLGVIAKSLREIFLINFEFKKF
jgi:hypothetical protein